MIKQALLFLHRWLGIITGIVVVVVSITGAIFVFEEELFQVFHPSLTHVEPGKTLVDINTLQASAQAAIGKEKPISLVFIYGDPTRAYCFVASKRHADSKSWWEKDEIAYYNQVFVDPYTGQVLGAIDKSTEFFYLMRRIHQNLLLRRDIGNMVVGWSVAIFVFILITGIVLWWPQRVAQIKQSITVKWNAKWKRVNYDLHNVLGFYSFIFALIIALTGLTWSFEWWEESVFNAMGSSKKKDVAYLNARDTTYTATAEGITRAWHDVRQRYNADKLQRITFNFPTKKNARVGGLVHYHGDSWWKNADYVFYNGATGDLSLLVDHEAKTLGMKWRNSNYDIHTGKIYGWPTQVLAVVVSLICASLPITGFIMWLHRRKKEKKRAKKAAAATGEKKEHTVKPYKPRPSVSRKVTVE
ncbi:PepSY-associated TM helix domain-containing protein [Dawidia soli]|uniref:PepSY domain-containing protein n=1 Tax=Dawidia soli TaxID=2782352 RepID=A0AAP2D940_9BACT|nr:PepSY-associated TM helix domain-containing protein [Dawidia soli]MBT1687509.1 PepSY domain-containing protein [Dawidia soli]